MYIKIILMIFILSFSLFGANIDDFASKVNFSRNYKSAFAEAEQTNKPLMLVIVTDDCPWCKKLERSTLDTKDVKKELLDVVPVIVDSKYDRDNFPAKYVAKRTPTIFFIDPRQNKKFYENVGYLKKNDFLLLLDSMQKAFKK